MNNQLWIQYRNSARILKNSFQGHHFFICPGRNHPWFRLWLIYFLWLSFVFCFVELVWCKYIISSTWLAFQESPFWGFVWMHYYVPLLHLFSCHGHLLMGILDIVRQRWLTNLLTYLLDFSTEHRCVLKEVVFAYLDKNIQ